MLFNISQDIIIIPEDCHAGIWQSAGALYISERREYMRQSWLDKLERKIGWLRIPGLMRYIIAIELVGAFIGVFSAIYFVAMILRLFIYLLTGCQYMLIP